MFRLQLRTALLLLALTSATAWQADAAINKHSAISDRLAPAQAVIREMNRVRTDPQGYAAYLETCRPYYTNDHQTHIPGQMTMRTQEGVGALDEAIRVLRHTSPVAPLEPSAGLTAVAAAYAGEQAATGGVGHRGQDGSTPFSRMSRYGTWQEQAAENVDYGPASAQQIVASLVIDDGDSSRGHRRNILNQDFHVAGAGLGRHPRFGTVCVIDFAVEFVAR